MLLVRPVSKSSAHQRAGRAGREVQYFDLVMIFGLSSELPRK